MYTIRFIPKFDIVHTYITTITTFRKLLYATA